MAVLGNSLSQPFFSVGPNSSQKSVQTLPVWVLTRFVMAEPKRLEAEEISDPAVLDMPLSAWQGTGKWRLHLEQTISLQSDKWKLTPTFVAMVVHSTGQTFRWKSHIARLECSLWILDSMSLKAMGFDTPPLPSCEKLCWIQYSAQQIWQSRIRTSVQRTTQAEVTDTFNKSFNFKC